MKILTAVLFAAAALAQQPSGVVDVYMVKIKPERRTDFDGIARKIADANRRFKGDNWIAYSSEYGDGPAVMFSSVRESYAAIDKASEMFLGAMKEGYGSGFMKLFQDMNNCALGTRSEIRRRRQDLSWNVPDQAGLYKLVGESRYIRVLTSRARAGHVADYEEAIKLVRSGMEKSNLQRPVFVSQAVAGQANGTFYSTSFLKAFGDLDAGADLRQMLGSEGYARYAKLLAEATLSSEWTIWRIAPELSNPPEEIVSANPAFWRPKPAAAKPAAAKPAQAKTN